MPRSKLLYTGAVAAIMLVGMLFLLFNDIAPPTLSLTPKTNTLGTHQSLALTVEDPNSSIKSVTITVAQKKQHFVLLNRDFTTRENTQKIHFSLAQANLTEGAFELIITATDRSWANFGQGNSVTQRLAMFLDTKPPRINIISQAPNIRRGSVTALAYTVSEAVSKTGMLVDGQFFPAFLQKNGKYFVFFPFPISTSTDTFKPKLIAYDLAGNNTRTPIIVNARARDYPRDTLRISDKFLRAKMPAFVKDVPDAKTDLEPYVIVTNDVRLANDAALVELAKKTAPTMLWSGAMLRLPRSAARAQFGDERTYTYNGKTIDRQTHMGLDLASTAKASIPAANTGRVVFTGPLGIHGNAIVIDHGLGLMTLYSHLSKIMVAVDDDVKKGDTIGKTGSTGLAGGDHLHFGVLVGGVQSQPMDWFDAKWVSETIVKRLPTK